MAHYKIKPIYDLKEVRLPRLWGRPLKAMAKAIGTPYVNPLIRMQLLKEGGLEDLRKARVSHAPVMMPQHPVEQPVRPEEVRASHAAFQAHLNKKLDTGATSPIYHSVTDFASAYRSGDITPSRMAERLIDALHAQQKGINAITHFNEQHILLQAEESTRRINAGEARSLFEGVPVSVKDELDAVPYCTTVGTRIFGQDGSCRDDATVVARLRAAGAIICGKANMHEIGIDLNGYNPHTGLCRNPYHPGHSTGGSSSGSASAVAAGLGPVSLGADGGGSVRIPAALCGQVGLKATWGRVSEHGAAPLCWSVAHIGPIATCVDDVALTYATIAGADDNDPLSQHQPDVHLINYTRDDLSGLKFGIFKPWFEHADKEVVLVCRAALQHLESHGAEMRDVYIDGLNAMRVAHAVTIASEMLSAVEQEYAATPEKFSAATRIALGFANGFTAADYVKAQRIRAKAMAEFQALFNEVDVIITPTSPVCAPPILEKSLPEGESDFAMTTRLMRFMAVANLTGLPALTIPVGYNSAGLPIGLQLIGRAWEEHVLLQMGRLLEQQISKQKPEVLYRLI